MNITITPAAEKFMRRMVRFNGDAPGSGFRLTVSEGGCSGLASEFTIEAAPLTGDASLVLAGLNIFLPVESRLLLEGVTVDFSDNMMQSGLKFINPNAASCGCSSTASGTASGTGADLAGGLAAVSVSSIQRRV
jgi:iron-sulfur cluster assembly accessory protein